MTAALLSAPPATLARDARTLAVGVVTDEVSRSLREALETAASWGLARVELREGGSARFPAFSPDEIAAVDGWRQGGGEVTAVSPGLFKGHVADTARLRRELDRVLPASLDLAVRFGCPTLVAFGFERTPDEPPDARRHVVDALRQAAEQAAAAGLRVAVENEPAFWVDHPEESVSLVREVDHLGLGLNWDPANLHWGGRVPTRDDIATVRPVLVNVHVKDYGTGRPHAPWWPLGEGQTPWADLIAGLLADTDLAAVTLETHCEPLLDASRASLSALRRLIADAEAARFPFAR